MWPKWHLLYNFIFCFVLIYFFDISLFCGATIFLSSILIDLDHLIPFFKKERSINPIKFWKKSVEENGYYSLLSTEEKRKIKKDYFVFHGVESLIFLWALSIFHSIFLWILIGFSVHILLDLANLLYDEGRFSTKISIVWLYISNR